MPVAMAAGVGSSSPASSTDISAQMPWARARSAADVPGSHSATRVAAASMAVS